jgi:hypothetical protein
MIHTLIGPVEYVKYVNDVTLVRNCVTLWTTELLIFGV